MVCPPWHVSLAWRSPRSIPTGQDGRRPLQHKLGVTYIYVLKCITHRHPPPPPPPPDGVAFLLPPASTLPGLASHSATRTPNFIIIISPAWYPPSHRRVWILQKPRGTRASNDNIEAEESAKFERINHICVIAAYCAYYFFGDKVKLFPSYGKFRYCLFLDI